MLVCRQPNAPRKWYVRCVGWKTMKKRSLPKRIGYMRITHRAQLWLFSNPMRLWLCESILGALCMAVAHNWSCDFMFKSNNNGTAILIWCTTRDVKWISTLIQIAAKGIEQKKRRSDPSNNRGTKATKSGKQSMLCAFFKHINQSKHTSWILFAERSINL